MKFTLQCHNQSITTINKKIEECSTQLRLLTSGNPLLHHSIRSIIHFSNAGLYECLQSHKKFKFDKFSKSLQPSSATSSTHTPRNAIICIPPSIPLSENERRVLERGLNFVPLTRSIDAYKIRSLMEDFYRRLRLKFHFYFNPSTNDSSSPFHKFKPKSYWTPPEGQSRSLDLFIQKTRHDLDQLNHTPIKRFNLSPGERAAITSLKQRDDIIIKPADKGKTVVVWDKATYIAEAERQLKHSPTFYSQTSKDQTVPNNHNVHNTIKSMIQSNELPPDAIFLHNADSNLGKPCFYLLPKVHKLMTPTPGRPIVSACSCPTENISTFLDSIFQPLVQELPSYIKDTTHALNVFKDIHFDDNVPRRLFLLDVVSLYTSIPHKYGLQALKYFLNQRQNHSISTTTILRLAELVLNLNSFEFNGEFFNQISGVAMGTRMGPSYACLFMGYLEHLIFESYGGAKPEVYLRYIDDGFGITSISEEELTSFFNFIEDFAAPYGIKFTFEQSTESVNFLDLSIRLNDHGLTTTVFYKPTDSHSYLLYSSSHPTLCKNSIPFSQFLRLRRICSVDEDFHTQSNKMVSFFVNRGYPFEIIQSALRRVIAINRTDVLSLSKRSDSSERVPLVLPFHPHVSKIVQAVKANLQILQCDEDAREVFPSPPMIAYKRQPNLKDILVHSRMTKTVLSSSGTHPCKRPRCKTCPFIDETTTFQFPNCTFTVKDSFSCTSRNVVYAIRCKLCNFFYVGETGSEISTRFGHHRRDIENDEAKPVPQHFNRADHHGLHHVSIFVLKSCSGNTFQRKSTENKFIKNLGTLSPHGINVSHSYL